MNVGQVAMSSYHRGAGNSSPTCSAGVVKEGVDELERL